MKKLVFSDRALTEHSVQILSGKVLLRISENFLRVAGFDDFTEIQEHRIIGDSQCLPQGMCHHYDRILLLEFHKEILDSLAGYRVQSTGCLISQNKIRLHRKTPRKAEPLLLTYGKTSRGTLKSVLDLIPQTDLCQILLHDLRHLLFLRMHAMNTAAIGDIVENRHRKRTRTLRNQSDTPAEFDEIRILGTDYILVTDHDLSVNLHPVHIIYQPVESFQQCALSTA